MTARLGLMSERADSALVHATAPHAASYFYLSRGNPRNYPITSCPCTHLCQRLFLKETDFEAGWPVIDSDFKWLSAGSLAQFCDVSIVHKFKPANQLLEALQRHGFTLGRSALCQGGRRYKLRLLYGCRASSRGPIKQKLQPSQWPYVRVSKNRLVYDMGSS